VLEEKGSNVKTTISLVLLLGATSMSVFGAGPTPVPEIDASSAAAAITLISGGLLLLRARRRK